MPSSPSSGRCSSNRQISKEMMLAEKTVKNLVSSVLAKLGMARRTQAAVLITKALNPSEDPADGDYGSGPYPDLIAEVTAALLNCTREAHGAPHRRTAGKGRRAACRRTYRDADRSAGTPPAAKPD